MDASADKSAIGERPRTHTPQARGGRVVVERLELPCGPGALVDELGRHEEPVLLESTAAGKEARWTVFSCRPVDVLTVREGVLTDRAGRRLAAGRGLWPALSRAFASVAAGRPSDAGEYLPGWMGYVGYEIGRHIERLPGRCARDTALPDLRLGFYDAVLVHDATDGSWRLLRLAFDDPPPGAGRSEQTLREAIDRMRDCPSSQVAPTPTGGDLPIQCEFTPDQYKRAVARCIEYIASGDIFQVNLSQRFRVEDAPDPVEVYRVLRRRNPAGYAAYLGFESLGRPCAVVSSSPELFLRVRDGHAVTRPIKGTRRRAGDVAADRAAAEDLLASPKDNAELAMIVDLLRNDLGRVCAYGSVRVVEPRRLEAHPTVLHLVATVEGRLRDGVGPAELLRATFPGGSITGAPKIRAMEIIDELEPAARGVYTGCIGHVGVDGACTLNIAIRTIVCNATTGPPPPRWRAFVQAGGGIVADSDPDAEYNETLDKARALLDALRVAGRATAEAGRG